MKTDNELVAEGLHPTDVEWLQNRAERAEATIKRVKLALKEKN